MKKIVLYAIGALCMLAQNSMGSDNIRQIDMSSYGEPVLNSLPISQEMTNVTNQILYLSSIDLPLSKSGKLKQLVMKCLEMFAEDYHFARDDVRITPLNTNSRTAFMIQGIDADRLTRVIWQQNLPCESIQMKKISNQ